MTPTDYVEIERLTPYALKYAGDFLRTPRGRATAKHRGGVDDLLADVSLIVCEFVALRLPAIYFKKYCARRLCDLSRRSMKSPRFSQESTEPGLSLAESVEDARRAVSPLESAARVELFRVTARLPLLLRSALRRSLLGERGAWRLAPVPRSTFLTWRVRILKEIKKRLEY